MQVLNIHYDKWLTTHFTNAVHPAIQDCLRSYAVSKNLLNDHKHKITSYIQLLTTYHNIYKAHE